MKRPFFARYALIILMVIAFFTPFAMRGARIAVSRIKNDVKDWLPADFAETTDLDWFRDHFLGEQFLIASWEGCTGTADDERFQDFVDGLFPEVPPSLRQRRDAAKSQGLTLGDPRVDKYPNWKANVNRDEYIDPELGLYTRQLLPSDLPPDEEFIGNQLGLFVVDNDFQNWAGKNEKWLKGDDEVWYFITPKGDLYRWTDDGAVFAPIFNAYKRWNKKTATATELVASLGPTDGPWYYKDPHRLSARLFKSVTTGPSVLAQLTNNTTGLKAISREEGIERLEGYLFGREQRVDETEPDTSIDQPRQTCLVLTLTDAAKRDLHRTIGRGILGKPRGEILRVAENADIHVPAQPSMIPPAISWMFPQPPPQQSPSIKLGGPPVDNVAIDEEGQITLVRLLGFSLLVGIGLSWLSFRSVAITIMVFLVGGLSAVVSVSIVYWSDSSIDAILLSMPSLVYVLGLSGAVHIVNYYRETVEEFGTRGAPERAVKLGWKPCTLAAFTTSLGLLSLLASNILPIRKFGLFAAVGVLATLVLLFTYLPSAIQLWAPARFRRPSAGGRRRPFEQLIERTWQSIGQFVIKHHRGVLASCLAILALMAYGCANFIKTDVQLLKMFDSNATIINHYEWLEKNLGELIPVELVVKVASEKQLATDSMHDDPNAAIDKMLFVERIDISTHVNRVLKDCFRQPGEERIGQTMAATTFVPDWNMDDYTVGGSRYRAHQTHVSKTLEARSDELVSTDYLRYDKSDGSELWRISVRLGALSDTDYAPFVGELKEVVEPVMHAYRYRDKIVETLRASTADGRVSNKKVFLAGVPLHLRGTHNAKRRAGNETPTKPDPTDPTVIFTRTLYQLLSEIPGGGIGISGLYNPDYEPPADWNQEVAGSDLVLVFNDCQGLDADALQGVGTLDVRDHRFDVGVSQTAQERGENVSVVYTGLVPVVYKAQHTLLDSLIESTGLAFIMIAAVMMLVLRSPFAGLCSMLPNIFPVISIFGIMCWCGFDIDIGSMMTASVAMGVAVDDTIHFMTWFRSGLDQGLDRYDAILLAYKRVGTAMTQTTAIGGLGLAVFAFSTFTPTQRFGALMLALLVAALVGDLIFLPALLASRQFGWVFDKKKGDKAGRDPSANPSSVDLNPPTTAPFPPGHISMSPKRQSPKPT